MPGSQKFFRFKLSDYNTSMERVQQNSDFYTGNPIRMGGENTAIEYMRDQQILNLFFILQVDKSPLVIIPPAPPRSRTQKIYDYTIAVILLLTGIGGAIYLLN
jgi:hypothetical protein